MPEVTPSLSCCHAFLLELQAASPGYRIVVQIKWHSINVIDSMEVFVGFKNVSSCSSIIEDWELKLSGPVTYWRFFSSWTNFVVRRAMFSVI